MNIIKFEFFGYELIIQKVPKGLQFVTEDEHEKRKRQVYKELEKMR